MVTHEEEVVREIRRNTGVDDNSDNPVVQNLKHNLKHSLQVLHEDLYSRPAHFVLELIQNADDNQYDAGVTPELRIFLNKEYIEIHCNEVGFSEENVRAFCAIGKSTKKNQSGYIGEKGIGVKSMFQVADRVYVQSRGYSFFLNRDEELGMISPRWTTDFPPKSGWTKMRLTFCDDRQFAIVKEQLEDVQKTVLLFMRRLTRLSVHVDTELPFESWREINGDVVTIHMTGASAPSFSFIRIAEEIPAYRSEIKRSHSLTTEIVLAFPLSSDGQPWMGDQAVYAFLPLRQAGFTFMIQADFLTTANREDILWKLPWNEHIRDHIAQVFLSAVLKFNSLPHLELTWLRFLPLSTSVKKDFFAPVTRGILKVVRESEMVKCTDGKFRRPASVKFCDSFEYSGTVLIPAEHLNFFYASFEYPQDVMPRLLDLGVTTMSISDFVNGLISMGQSIVAKGNSWLEIVCFLICREGTVKQAKDSTWNLLDLRICNLPIAQLRDGQWTRPDIKTMFFDERNLPFPTGLDISLLQSHSQSPWRRQLLERIGVKDVDESIVVDRILVLHRRQSPSFTEADMLEHALYVFERRHIVPRDLKYDSLWLPNTNGNVFRGNNLYINNAQSSNPLRDILQSPAEFIHDSFMSPEFALRQSSSNVSDWLQWLQTELKVSASLRVDSTGRPAKEFIALINRLRLEDSRRLLLILKENWPGIQEQLASLNNSRSFFAYFSNVKIRCRYGIEATISSTTLPYDGVSRHAADDLPQLPVPEPLHDWEFLSRFGVSITQDATFYLKALVAVSRSGNGSGIRKLYKQLEARFNEIPSQITVEFETNKLIFVEGNWLSLSEVVWEGPSVMQLKTPLQPHYQELDELFHVGLKIPNASDSAIGDELRHFSTQHRSRPVTQESYTRLIQLLEYAASTIELIRSQKCEDWTRAIANVSFLPVRRPGTSSTMLSSREGKFYLADANGTLQGIFSPHVAFLDIRPEHAVRLGPLFEHLNLEQVRIERCVTETVLVEGRSLAAEIDVNTLQRRTNYPESEFYRSRLSFFQRLQFYRLQSLIKSIRVLNVDELAVSYTLQGQRPITLSRPRKCWARHSNGELQLFVQSSLPQQHRRGTSVAEVLASCLGLSNSDIPVVATILRFDPNDADELLHKSGVRNLDPAVVPPPPPPLVDTRNDRPGRQAHPSPAPVAPLPPPASLPTRQSGGRGLPSASAAATSSTSPVEPTARVLPGFVPSIRDVASPAPSSPAHGSLALAGLTASSLSNGPPASLSGVSRIVDGGSQVSSGRISSPVVRNESSSVQAAPRAPLPSAASSLVHPDHTTRSTSVNTPPPAAIPEVSLPSRRPAPPVAAPSPTPTLPVPHVTPSLPPATPVLPSAATILPIAVTSTESVHQRTRSSAEAEGIISPLPVMHISTTIPSVAQETTRQSPTTTRQSPTTARVSHSRWIVRDDDSARTFIGTDEGRVAMEELGRAAEQMNIPAAFSSASFELNSRSSSPSPPSSPTPRRTRFSNNHGDGMDVNVSSVGYLGEKYVYDLLRSHLPSFGIRNWTSELRELANLHDSDSDSDSDSDFDVWLADFTYRDAEGALTAMLLPGDAPEAPPLAANPEYFIEVKTTSGDASEPFFMSRSQFQTAYRLSRLGRLSPAQQVYVIFRVSGLRSGATPEVKVYIDPHALIAQGVLRIESDEVEVSIPKAA